jgi:hypothetical protein
MNNKDHMISFLACQFRSEKLGVLEFFTFFKFLFFNNQDTKDI